MLICTERTYDINAQAEPLVKLTRKFISLLYFADYAMKLDVMVDALSVEVGEKANDVENRIESTLPDCSQRPVEGLVVVDGDRGEVRF